MTPLEYALIAAIVVLLFGLIIVHKGNRFMNDYWDKKCVKLLFELDRLQGELYKYEKKQQRDSLGRFKK